MATAGKKYLPYIIDKFYGGRSEDEYLSNGKDFSYSQNCDIYENSKALQLSREYTDISLPVTTGYITKILRLPNDIQSNAYFTSIGEIFIDAGAGPVLVKTLADADKYILNAICFGVHMFVFTATDVHQVHFTGDDFKTYASTTEALFSYTATYKGFSANESKDLPLFNLGDGFLYFGAGNKLFSIDAALSAVSTSKTFSEGSKIIGITWLNSNLKVYVNWQNVESKLFFRNDVTSDFVIYKNKVFKAVSTDGQLDYVVCSDGLYVFNGYNSEKLYNINLSDFGKSGSGYYIPQNLVGLDPYYRYVGYNGKVYKFGKKFTNMPNGFSLDVLLTNNITALIENITVSGNVYLATDDKKVYLRSTTKYRPTGYLEGIVFFGDTMEKKKKLDRVFVAYTLNAGEQIDIYFSVDGAAYGAAAITITDTTAKYKEFFATQLSNLTYHWIKPKVVLTTPSTYTTTPKILEVSMFSEYVTNI